MRLIVADTYDDMSTQAADLFADLIAANPTATILPATGNTPMGMYRVLADRTAQGELDASRLRVFQLDEYCGLPSGDYRSLFGWTSRSFIEPLGIQTANVTPLPGNAADAASACAAYDRRVADEGGIDIAILGLGPNGHLGFNEPPSEQDAPTRLVSLTPESVISNGPYWGGDDRVPRQAVTAGMTVILAAKTILLVVSGKNKRAILRETLQGPVTSAVPSSFLQQASNVTVFADKDAYRF